MGKIVITFDRMAKFVALDLLQQFSSDARQARGADSDDTPAVGGSVVAGGSGAAGGRQPVGGSSHQAPLSRRGRDVSDSDDDYQPVHDDYCGSSSDGSGSEGFSDQEARTMRSRRVPDETVWHVDDEDDEDEAAISGVHSLLVPDTPCGAVGAVSGLDQTGLGGLGADLFDDTAGPDFAINPVVPVTPGDWSASAVADVVGSILGGSVSSHQVSASDQASGSRKRSSVGIMKNGGTKRKAVGRPKSQSTPARSGPAFAEPMDCLLYTSPSPRD